jgi:hypothetical protein
VAAVGSWTLGAVGPNTLSATVAGATAGSPAGFTATGQEIVIQPAADTTMSGVVVVTRLIVPAGVTITVTDSLRLTADSVVEIRGAIQGNCVPVRIDGRQSLTIKGTIRNDCANATDAGAPLTLIGRLGYQVDSATIETSGDLLLTNDPSLTDADVIPGASVAGAPAEAGAAFAAGDCLVSFARFEAKPGKAADGTAGPIGTAGRRGTVLQAACRGALEIQGEVVFQAQDGGDGGEGSHLPAAGNAVALGGPGGEGGRVDLRASGTVVFSGLGNSLISGFGGRGGDARAVAGSGPAGSTAPNAAAEGGKGGSPGLASIQAVSRVEFADATSLLVGFAGNGGRATAVGARGADAAGATTPAQAGGAASAFAGQGGATPDRRLTPQNLTIVNPANLTVFGGGGGLGGTADATGGEGGTGVPGRPDGGNGGKSESHAGFGGSAELRDHFGVVFGPGGVGGHAINRGARGGLGIGQCSLPLGLLPGGKGGDGGAILGFGGVGGIGKTFGADGDVIVMNAGNGGNGGHGEPRGVGGSGGPGTLPASAQLVGTNRSPGRSGFDCISGGGDFTSIINGTLNSNPCPTTAFNQSISSFSPNPVAFQVTHALPQFGAFPSSGFLAAAPGPTTEWATTQVSYRHDLCLMQDLGPLVQGPVSITYTLGPTTVVKSFNVKYEFRP